MVQSAETKARNRILAKLRRQEEPEARTEANRRLVEECRAQVAAEVEAGKRSLGETVEEGRKRIKTDLKEAEQEGVQAIRKEKEQALQEIRAASSPASSSGCASQTALCAAPPAQALAPAEACEEDGAARDASGAALPEQPGQNSTAAEL